ncbi:MULTISPECIES: aminodeoxychorismate synthase component I [Streptomyces]|uniref:aminodeoxychorismate synthase n=1 Tax=Streptomyces pini TaxID=1520580 RepID=A0A1I4CQG8_9ACTN|nr:MULTISPECIES: aminodeoxychorismate synthase component I [Streptomyces]SFK82880.1 aminodeoxychorismate synthase, subunit I /aminodeoxychorismate synthase, glutamine amidotransferase subunit [Streptomyces pini]
MRTLLVDNHDSYTFNLYQLLARTYGTPPHVLANDDPRLTASLAGRFDAIAVSPGPGRPQRARDTGRALDVVRESGLPTLGVCLGHQGLARLAGARVVPAPRPRHGHLTRVEHRGEGLFAGLPQGFTAVRYHSLCVTGLPDDVEADAWAEDGVLMGFHHRFRPWWGAQFHPESIATEYGAELLENFRELATAHRSPSPLPVPSSRPVPSPLPARAPGKPRTLSDGRPRWTLHHARLPYAVDAGTAFRELCADRPYAFWLDSSRTSSETARFSFVGHPDGPSGEVLRYAVGTGHVEVLDADGRHRCRLPGGIFDVLDRRTRERPAPHAPELPFGLKGGYVGYLGYEVKADCGSPNARSSSTPDAVWMTATRFLVVDHEENDTWLVAASLDEPAELADARRWLAEAARRAPNWRRPDGDRSAEPAEPANGVDPEAWLEAPRGVYLERVRACLDELHAGESYEICLTTEARIPFRGDAFALYLRQRALNPAPYAAYLQAGDTRVLCSSPERFLKIGEDGVAEARPIKGTAPRHRDPAEDARAGDELASSPKTRAENLMIVDLLRNDLGRVCGIGSVDVPSFMNVESYTTVHQLVTTVRGRLLPGVGPVRAVRACFPGGSMTGAPKLRTMEIIGRLEDRPRGVYSGALGFIGLTGAADLNIVIRTAVAHGGCLDVGAGGAVVLDSDPAAEYEEMLVKLRAPLRGLAAPDTPVADRGKIIVRSSAFG